MELTILMLILGLLVGVSTYFGKLLVPFFYFGAIFVPTSPTKLKTIVSYAQDIHGPIVELGVGSGAVAVALAKQGHQLVGIDIDAGLLKKAQAYAKKERVDDTVLLLHENFWRHDLSQYQGIYVYGIPHIMNRLSKKIQTEAKKGTVIISNNYQLKNLDYTEKKNGVYKYVL